MIMSSIIITATGLTAVILSSLRQSRAIDEAITAYYAAESGIEKGIYEFRRLEQVPGEETADLENNSNYSRTVLTKEPVIFAGTLLEDNFIEVALYDPDQPTLATNIATVNVSWSDTCGGCSMLEASMVGWQAGGPVVWDPNATILRFLGGSAVLSALPNRLYRLRLFAKLDNLDNLQIRAYSSGGIPIDLPGRVTISSLGSFATAKQRIVASMPRQTPLSGLYDFVIFSECSLVKGGPISCPTD
jgi:hypothetical protein